ncbi:MAG TPA: glucose 1-dehydrogenase [Gemmatimonadaceae bacterium]|nr:glucose 1-dehydrogenase [Gemmatimonadaceae bacterium]
MRLSDKTAVVTGGASGIGLAIAEAFIAEGARVHVLDVRADAARDTAAGLGPSAVWQECDVASEDSVRRAFGAVLTAGPVDILVNNAGIAHVGSVEQTTGADFDRLFAVNVKGAYHCISAVIGAMKARRSGVILNIASIAASAGLANRFAYSMTKGAIVAMTYSVARDYVTDGIRCVSISPARIHTPFVDGFIAQNYPGREKEMFDKLAATQPVGRMGEPREVASLAVYLCSDEAKFVTGADYPLDGGFLTLHG